MKRYFFFSALLIVILTTCKKNVPHTKSSSKSVIATSFQLNGKLNNFKPEKVFLNKIIEHRIYPIDSSDIIDDKFTFNGVVEFPERYAITFKNYSAIVIVILENTVFNILVDYNNIDNPQITGSNLNSKLDTYKTTSKNIFRKIDYLYPEFQKARLENDAKKLQEVEIKMRAIEKEFVSFSYSFVFQNKNSPVAAMVLRDHLKSTTVDTLQLKKTYQILSEDVKKTPDAQIIASFLNLN